MGVRHKGDRTNGKTVIGWFDTEQGAERAMRDLMSRGFARDDISVVANNASGVYSADGEATVGDMPESFSARPVTHVI